MTAPAPDRPPVAAIAGLLTVMLLAGIEATVVGTAMPTVVADIGGMAFYPWAFSAFMLTSTIATPFYGRFADQFGVRRCLFVAIAVFLAGSVLCALATTMPALIAFRALQGLGAGGINILVLTAFGLLFAPEVRGRAQGLLSLVWGVSSLLGPVVGGLIVDSAPWPWIFWINLPVGAVATALIIRGVPAHGAPPVRHAFDWPGAAMLAGGLAGVMLAVSTPSPPFLVLGGAGAALLGAFAMRQARVSEPLIPLAPFKSPLFRVPLLIGVTSTLTMFTTIAYMPLFVQGALGASASQAAIVLVPMMLGWPLFAFFAGRWLNRLGFRALMLAGAGLMIACYVMLATAGARFGLLGLGLQAMGLGGGMGLISAPALVASQLAVPRAQMGAASGAITLFRNIGGSLGVTLFGGLQLALYARFAASVSAPEALRQTPRALLEPAARQALAPETAQALMTALAQSLQAVFALSALVAIATLAFAFKMPAGSPLTLRAPE